MFDMKTGKHWDEESLWREKESLEKRIHELENPSDEVFERMRKAADAIKSTGDYGDLRAAHKALIESGKEINNG